MNSPVNSSEQTRSADGSGERLISVVPNYETFLRSKAQDGTMEGFAPVWMPSFLFDFQSAIAEWNIRKGKSATFADCGMGKTAIELVWAENVVRKCNKPVLILTPLAVAQQTVREAAKFGIEARRSSDGKVYSGINVTNYERLRYFKPEDFAGVVCDESSAIKAFNGKRRAEVTEFLRTIPYRLLATATAAPNDYIELGTSAEALGVMGQIEMLNRFFKNDQNTSDMKRMNRHSPAEGGPSSAGWRFKGHAEIPFFRWVCSWARGGRRPSDFGPFADDRFKLPKLIEREHIVETRTMADGMLFPLPATNMQEEREERRRTINERCEMAAELVAPHDYSVVWCGLNDEGDLLERLIPNSLQVSGSDADEYKETVAEWFTGNRCVCNEPWFGAKLAIWRRSQKTTGSAITKSIESSGLLTPFDTSKSTEKPSGNISSSITRSIRPRPASIDAGPLKLETQDAVSSIPQTSELETPKRQRLRTTESAILKQNGLGVSSDTDSHLRTTTAFLPLKAGAAQSAAADLAINGPSDSTLITATSPKRSEVSSAPDAIWESENSETMPIASNGRRCICGYASGPRRLISKSKIFGFGLNFQHCAHVVTFASHSYEQYYQSVRRCWRFGQTRPVTVDLIVTEGERGIADNLHRKSAAADRMFTALVEHMHESLTIESGYQFTKDVEVPSWLSSTN